jgi:hypothetical protein
MDETNGSEVNAELGALFQQHADRLNAAQYRIGRLCNEVMSQGLPGVLSYEGAMRYLGVQRETLSREELRKWCAVARKFTEEDCVRYGVRRLSLLAKYSEKINVPWAQGDPGPTPIMVPAEEGPPLQKPFAHCTEEELGLAISPPKRSPRKPLVLPPRTEAHCVQLLRDGVQKRFPKQPRARVCTRVSEGRIELTLKRISVLDLELLVGAILESLEPLHEELHRRTLVPRPPGGLRLVPSPGQPLRAPADPGPLAPACAPAPAASGARTAS